MNISPVIIVKDAESTITKTLDSLKEFDNVIVYDTGSSDTTVQIAKNYDNVVLHLSYFAGFSESKNRAAQLAKNDWILSIDADEVVSPELLSSLKKLKIQENTAYRIKRDNYYRNRIVKYSGWGKEYVIRLYNKLETQFNSKLVHEHINYSHLKLITLNGELRHYSYHSISNFVIKRDWYSTLFAIENKGKRKSSPLIALIKGGFDFLYTFLVRRGFMDGYRGLLISVSNANVTFFKYLKLYELNITNDSKISLIIYCDNLYKNIDKTIESILNQSLPPDEIIICSESTNLELNKEIDEYTKSSFIPIYHINSKNTNPIDCINKAIEITNSEFIITCNGNSMLFSSKFISANVNKTKPGTYQVCNSRELPNILYKNLSNKKKVVTNTNLLFGFKRLLLTLAHLIKHKEQNNNSPCSISFFKNDYNTEKETLNGNYPIKQLIVNNLKKDIIKKEIKSPILQYHKKSNKKKVLICLDRLKFLNCGLGQVALNFGREILNNKPIDYDIVFMIPRKGFEEFEKRTSYIKLSLFRSNFARYMKNYDLCHIPHQLPSYNFGYSNKNVLTIHDLNFIFTKSLYKSNRYLKHVQRNIKKADSIVFISDFTKQMSYKYLDIPNTKKTQVIYNGVIMPENSKTRPEWLPNQKFLFSIGQFLEKKNFHVLLPFIQKLPNDIILVIAGENKTSYSQRLKEEVLKLNIQNKIIFPGGISEKEKGYLFHNCEAFLFPSIAEGFGLPVIEAMLCSKPVFCSDKTSLREISREFAFFWTNFELDNMIKVYENGMKTIKETNHLERQKIYAQSYTYKKNVEEYLKLYDVLLSDTP